MGLKSNPGARAESQATNAIRRTQAMSMMLSLPAADVIRCAAGLLFHAASSLPNNGTPHAEALRLCRETDQLAQTLDPSQRPARHD